MTSAGRVYGSTSLALANDRVAREPAALLLVQQRFLPSSVVWLLTARNLRQRTTGSVLGWVWLLIQPAFLLVTYTFVFGVVLQVQGGSL